MSSEGKRAHWDNVYISTAEAEVSLFQENPAVSLGLIAGTGAPQRSAIIDVGGGAPCRRFSSAAFGDVFRSRIPRQDNFSDRASISRQFAGFIPDRVLQRTDTTQSQRSRVQSQPNAFTRPIAPFDQSESLTG